MSRKLAMAAFYILLKKMNNQNCANLWLANGIISRHKLHSQRQAQCLMSNHMNDCGVLVVTKYTFKKKKIRSF